MRFIELFDGPKRIGEFELPDTIKDDSGNNFSLGRARKGGGNGVVFDARQYRNGSLVRTCAVKFLRRLDSVRVDRFSNEIRINRELHHNHIAEYFGDGTIKLCGHPVPWLAQELGGRNLREHVEHNGPILQDLLPDVASQMCSAVGHIHEKGFIHRDIKPDNFVWVENSNKEVMMIDFGIAKRHGEDVSARPMDSLTRTLEFVGPAFFSSPELIRYAKDKTVTVDQRSDVFQLGKTIWYLATGHVSAGVPSRKLCPMGGRLRDIVLATLDDDPSQRPQSPEDLRTAIQKL